MNPHEQVTLVAHMPWHLALVAGALWVAIRCRHRFATALAVGGLVVVLAGSVAATASLLSWLRPWLSGEGFDAAREVAGAAFRFHRPVGFALVIAAAFVGRSEPASPA